MNDTGDEFVPNSRLEDLKGGFAAAVTLADVSDG